MAVLALSVPGCGRNPYGNFVTVTGTLVCNGKPAKGATVVFTPADEPDKTGREQGNPGPASLGVVQEDGTFSLTTWNYMGVQERPGALVGPHKVSVEPPRTKTPGLTIQQQNFPPKIRAEVEAKLNALPIYPALDCGTKDVTPASVEVSSDETQNMFDFNLGNAPPPKRAPPLRTPGGRQAPSRKRP
jgi:hypothetical protein